MEHVLYVCSGLHSDGRSCMFCDGGLSACTVCGAFEGAWPDECPGEMMTNEASDEVYGGIVNFKGGEWVQGCCEVMRPIHDTRSYMREHAYELINDKWVHLEDV